MLKELGEFAKQNEDFDDPVIFIDLLDDLITLGFFGEDPRMVYLSLIQNDGNSAIKATVKDASLRLPDWPE
jgi:hypothetical protein